MKTMNFRKTTKSIITSLLAAALLLSAAPTHAASTDAARSRCNDKVYAISLGNGKTETITGHFDNAMAKKAVRLLNNYRKKHGLTPLKTTAALKKAAKTRAAESVIKQSHTRPNGLPWFTVDATTAYGENLADNWPSAAVAMKMWKHSASHNNNMLSRDYGTVGIAVFACRTETTSGDIRYAYYYVQLFGR